MKNKNSPLFQNDNKISKKIIRSIYTVLYCIYALVVVKNVVGLKNREGNLETLIVYLILFTICSVLMYRFRISKISRRSMKIMKHFCTYKELATYLSNEEFKLVDLKAHDEMYVSKHWIKFGEVFIPKKFVKVLDIYQMAHGNYTLSIIAIDGSSTGFLVGQSKHGSVTGVGIGQSLDMVEEAIVAIRREVRDVKVNRGNKSLFKLEKEYKKEYLKLDEEYIKKILCGKEK